MGSRLLWETLRDFERGVGMPLRRLPQDADPERVYLEATGTLLKRRQTCANRENGCEQWARADSTVCSDACRDAARVHIRPGWGKPQPDRREQVSGTRHPRELSSDGSGYS